MVDFFNQIVYNNTRKEEVNNFFGKEKAQWIIKKLCKSC